VKESGQFFKSDPMAIYLVKIENLHLY
jgi:hypothetical protein